MRVFKYDLPVADVVELELPVGAQVLTVQAQGEVPRVWALVDEEAPLERRRFHVVGTGHDAGRTPAGGYLGTFQLYAGGFVGHVFLEPAPS